MLFGTYVPAVAGEVAWLMHAGIIYSASNCITFANSSFDRANSIAMLRSSDIGEGIERPSILK